MIDGAIAVYQPHDDHHVVTLCQGCAACQATCVEKFFIGVSAEKTGLVFLMAGCLRERGETPPSRPAVAESRAAREKWIRRFRGSAQIVGMVARAVPPRSFPSRKSVNIRVIRGPSPDDDLLALLALFILTLLNQR